MSQVDKEMLDLSSVLSELCIAERNAANLHKILPSCIMLLADSCAETQKIITALTDSWLHCISLENLENVLLKDILDIIKSRVSQVYHDIQEMIKDANLIQINQQLVGEKLMENMNLLLAVEKILVHYSDFDRIPAVYASSTLTSISTVLSSGYHFKNSQTFYTNAVESVLEELSGLFQKSNHILLLFADFVMQKVHFNCENEDELLLLLETLDSVFIVAESVVANFDLKMMAVQWKFLFKLIQTHISYLRSRFDISKILSFLVNQVMAITDSIANQETTKMSNVTKELKACHFFLKIINNICKLFQDESKSCYPETVYLLCHILGYSSPYLKSINMPNTFVQEVDTFLTSFSEPFLSLMLMDSQFIQEFFEISKVINTMQPLRKIGFSLLTITILQKLLSHSDKNAVEDSWVRSEINIVDVAFQLMKNGFVEEFWNLNLQGEMYGDSLSSEIDPYRSLMISLSGFIVGTVSEADFSRIESTLLKNVCQQDVWPALLASDVWCAISRYASADLCLQQVQFFIKRIMSWPLETKFQPEWIFFTSLAARLFNFLSNSHKEQIIQKYPLSEENFSVWSALKIPVPETQQKWAELQIRRILLRFLCENENKLTNLIAGLEVATAINFELTKDQGDHFLKLVDQLWNCLSNVGQFLDAEEVSCGEKRWLHKFLCALSNFAVCVVNKLDNNQVLNILMKLKDLCKNGNSFPKICTLLILTAIGDKVLSEQSNKKKITETISGLFRLLLCDSNPAVRQVAYETFEYFSIVTRYGEVIPLTVAVSEDLKICMTNFLSHTPQTLSQPLDEGEYLKKLTAIKFVHKCSLPAESINSSFSSAVSIEKNQEIIPSKKIKLDCDPKVNLCITAIETNFSTLVPLLQSNLVNSEQKHRLRSVLKTAQNTLGIELF